MADFEVIREYLVSLGFETNDSEFRKFQMGLREAAKAVEAATIGISKDLLKWQAGILSGFAALGGSVLGMATNVAGADEQYRLLALRMFTSKNVAKELQVALDTLGLTLEQATWDPEARARVNQLIADQRRMIGSLGGAFDEQMIKIRHVGLEFHRLQVGAEYAIQKIVSDLAEHFGITIDEVSAQISKLAERIDSNLPEISQSFQKYFIPALNDTWDVMKELWDMAKDLAGVFQNLVGVLSGDKNLTGTAVTFDRIGEAIKKVIDWAREFVHIMHSVEEVVIHLANAVLLLVGGHIDQAIAELKQSAANFTPGAGALVGGATGLAAGGAVGGAAGTGIGAITGGFIGSLFGPVGTAFGAALGGSIGGVFGGAVGATSGAVGLGGLGYEIGKHNPDAAKDQPARGPIANPIPWSSATTGENERTATGVGPGSERTRESLTDWLFPSLSRSRAEWNSGSSLAQFSEAINAASQRYKIDPKLIRSVISVESSGDPNEVSKKGAMGLMQLMPETAREEGVKNPFDPAQNIMAGTDHLAKLLRQFHGNVAEALAGYNWGAGNLMSGQALPPETLQYLQRVTQAYNSDRGTGGSISMPTTIQVAKIEVHVTQPGATPEQVQEVVTRGVQSGITSAFYQQVQRDLTTIGAH